MSTDQGPVVQSALLRNELVDLRRKRGLTQQQVAKTLEWSASKLIRVEGGHTPITKVDLDALVSLYGVTTESERERLQALNREAREKGWWDSYRDTISGTYLSYVGLEAGAASIRQFQIGFIPGLLQTSEYARVVTEVGSIDGEERIESIVGLRMQRQAELAKRSVQPRQDFVIDEGVIRRHVGIKTDPSIMPNQLRYMADRAEQDELITVRVIPFNAGAHPGLFGPFTLLHFEGGLPEVLYIDAGRGEFTIASGEDANVEYAADFERLLEDALSLGESIELIRSAARAMS